MSLLTDPAMAAVWPTRQRVRRLHVLVDVDRPACNRHTRVNVFSAVHATTVPTGERCRRAACRARWPTMIRFRTEAP